MTDTAEIPAQTALLVKELGQCVRLIELDTEDLEKGSDAAEGLADELEHYISSLETVMERLRGD
ncbi:hypothetical protein ACF06X_33800 [Streptomyces sp. NPDC015346]|uniref:hypothetical protein n=1 Tax=Streptomyces sp. NPDC015346 TaxID=3364954 RepID=UPI0036FC27CE